MGQTCKVQIKTVYGVERVYPANEVAVEFATIAGTKTLEPGVLKSIQRLGYVIEVVHPTVRIAA